MTTATYKEVFRRTPRDGIILEIGSSIAHSRANLKRDHFTNVASIENFPSRKIFTLIEETCRAYTKDMVAYEEVKYWNRTKVRQAARTMLYKAIRKYAVEYYTKYILAPNNTNKQRGMIKYMVSQKATSMGSVNLKDTIHYALWTSLDFYQRSALVSEVKAVIDGRLQQSRPSKRS